MPALQRRPTGREGEYNYLDLYMLTFERSMEFLKNERSEIGKAQADKQLILVL